MCGETEFRNSEEFAVIFFLFKNEDIRECNVKKKNRYVIKTLAK